MTTLKSVKEAVEVEHPLLGRCRACGLNLDKATEEMIAFQPGGFPVPLVICPRCRTVKAVEREYKILIDNLKAEVSKGGSGIIKPSAQDVAKIGGVVETTKKIVDLVKK